MTKILSVLHSLGGGGIENLLYSYLTNMDREGLVFDFAVYGDEVGALEPKFIDMGCKVYHLPHRHDDLKAHIAKLGEVIRGGGYDVVHSHQSEKGFVTLRIARHYGVKTRILHVHNAFPPESAKQRLLRRLGASLGKRFATEMFACSRDAGLWLYGEKAVKEGRVKVIHNAIELSRFAFDKEAREEVRRELGIESSLAVFCAARFTQQKNHRFLLEIFRSILSKRQDAVLLLAGEGELMDATRARARELGIIDSVRFLGVRTDVPRLYNGMDAFLLPSIFEGLGIVFLEAQAAGLPTIGPDIPGARDTVVTDLMTAVKLNQPPEIWADIVLAACEDTQRRDVTDELRAAGYDVKQQAKELESYYRTVPHA